MPSGIDEISMKEMVNLYEGCKDLMLKHDWGKKIYSANMWIQPKEDMIIELFSIGKILRSYYNNIYTQQHELVNFLDKNKNNTAYLSQKIDTRFRYIESLISQEDSDKLRLPDPPTPTQPAPQDPPAPADAFGMMLQSMVATEVSKIKDKGISEEKIQSLIKAEYKKHSKRIEVKTREDEVVDVGISHHNFEELLHWINQGTNVMLTGPAGSGKTTAGEKVAEALSLPFSSLSLSNDTRAYALFGFTNGEKYTTTEFRKRYEEGGVFVLDEVDNGQANILSKLNSAIEQGSYAFDDKVVNKHKDFILISTANTWGFGGDTQYVGRNALDAAFLDRFVKIDWDYDEKLELAISPNREFTKFVQKLRKAANELKCKVIISPRTSIRGGRMLNANIEGMTEEKVLRALVWNGVSDSIVSKILKKVKYAD